MLAGSAELAQAAEPIGFSVTTEASAVGVGLLPPTMIDQSDLYDGAVLHVSQHSALVIRVNSSPELWVRGSVDIPMVAEFIPGRQDVSAFFNPGFVAKSAGVSTAHITDPATGTETTFLLLVS